MNESHDLTVSQKSAETHLTRADGHLLPTDQNANETQSPSVGGHHLAGSQSGGASHAHPAASQLLTVSQLGAETQLTTADGHRLLIDHQLGDTHCVDVDEHFLSTDHLVTESHSRRVGGQPPVVPPAGPATGWAQPTDRPPDSWVELRICADLFARVQTERVAVANMLRTSDHDMFGPILDNLEETEKLCKLALRRCYRNVVPASLRTLQKTEPGLGEDSFARILGHLGDPYIATPHWWEGTGSNRVLMQGEPYVRTIGQLWQYCGHGRPGRPAKGATATELAALGNPNLKMLVHLQAEWCIRQNGRYRQLYVAIREAVESKAHSVPCVRCGPSGKPALEGSEWSKGHQHAHALRLVGKEILRDMWLARHLEETA